LQGGLELRIGAVSSHIYLILAGWMGDAKPYKYLSRYSRLTLGRAGRGVCTNTPDRAMRKYEIFTPKRYQKKQFVTQMCSYDTFGVMI
jgi:hypothetical protein